MKNSFTITLALVAATLLAGCNVLRIPPDKYLPRENFGSRGATRCNTQQLIEPDQPACR